MKNSQLKQKIVSWTFSRSPFSFLGKLTQTNLLIPYYHIISDDKIPHVEHLYKYKTVRQFMEDMDFLLKHYSPMGLLEVLDFINNDRPFPEKVFLLTFDDGLREMSDIVAPILLEKGVCATFFINSAFIDNKSLCYLHKASILVHHLENVRSPRVRKEIQEVLLKHGIESKEINSGIMAVTYQKKNVLDEVAALLDVDFCDFLVGKKPYLTSEQIRKLIEDGFEIGAHSIDHPLYSSLSTQDQFHQTIESTRLIRENFCLDYGAFAFPHSDRGVSKKCMEEIYRSGLVEISFGTDGLMNDSVSNNLQRFSLEKPLLPAENIIAIQYAKRLIKLLMVKNEIVRE